MGLPSFSKRSSLLSHDTEKRNRRLIPKRPQRTEPDSRTSGCTHRRRLNDIMILKGGLRKCDNFPTRDRLGDISIFINLNSKWACFQTHGLQAVVSPVLKGNDA